MNQTIPDLKDLGKRDRAKIIREHPGMLAKIARELGVTRQTVSRVFNGKIERSPEVEAALNRELAVLKSEAA